MTPARAVKAMTDARGWRACLDPGCTGSVRCFPDKDGSYLWECNRCAMPMGSTGMALLAVAMDKELDRLRSEVARLSKREGAWLATCRTCEQAGCKNKATRIVTVERPPLGTIVVVLCDEHSAADGELMGIDAPCAHLIREGT